HGSARGLAVLGGPTGKRACGRAVRPGRLHAREARRLGQRAPRGRGGLVGADFVGDAADRRRLLRRLGAEGSLDRPRRARPGHDARRDRLGPRDDGNRGWVSDPLGARAPLYWVRIFVTAGRTSAALASIFTEAFGSSGVEPMLTIASDPPAPSVWSGRP